jgi:hypothetical protein
MANSHTSTMETSEERPTNFMKKGKQLSFSNILPTDTEDSRQDDEVHESSDQDMDTIERETFQNHVQTNQTVADTLIALQGKEDTNNMSEDDTTSSNSSPTSSVMRTYFRRVGCGPPSMPTLNHSDSSPPEDSEGGLVKRMLRRSLAWSQDSADTESQSWKRRKDNASPEFTTALWHLPTPPNGDTSPSCVHWEEKLTDLYGLTATTQESDDE